MDKIAEMVESLRPMLEIARKELQYEDWAKLERTYRCLEEVLQKYELETSKSR